MAELTEILAQTARLGAAHDPDTVKRLIGMPVAAGPEAS